MTFVSAKAIKLEAGSSSDLSWFIRSHGGAHNVRTGRPRFNQLQFNRSRACAVHSKTPISSFTAVECSLIYFF